MLQFEREQHLCKCHQLIVAIYKYHFMKHKFLFILLFIAAASCLRAQTIERQVTGAAGAYQLASWGSLSATVGEAVINTSSSGSLVLTQGFQQPTQTDVAVYRLPGDNVSVKVFPVPAVDEINVVINPGGNDAQYSVVIFDMPGSQIRVPCQNLNNGKETSLLFDIRSIATGSYVMLITDERNTQVKAIKFTKIN
jgi:hypothetical protein